MLRGEGDAGGMYHKGLVFSLTINSPVGINTYVSVIECGVKRSVDDDFVSSLQFIDLFLCEHCLNSFFVVMVRVFSVSRPTDGN